MNLVFIEKLQQSRDRSTLSEQVLLVVIRPCDVAHTPKELKIKGNHKHPCSVAISHFALNT
jgi:hypothetical protein